jgi:predicted nucleic acid-binding protein
VIAVDTNVLVRILVDDCLIFSNCRARDLELYTFDERLGKLGGAVPVDVMPRRD